MEYRPRSETSAREICVGKSSNGKVFCQNVSDFPCPYHPTNAPYTHLYPATYLTTRASGENLRAFKQSEFFSHVEQLWTEKVFQIVLFYFSNVRTRCLVFRRKNVSGCLSVTLHWHITDCHKLRRIVDVDVDRFSSQA